MITYPRGKETWRRPCKMHTPATEKARKQMKLHMVPASLTISGYMTKQDVDKTKNFKHLFLHVSLFGGKDYKSYWILFTVQRLSNLTFLMACIIKCDVTAHRIAAYIHMCICVESEYTKLAWVLYQLHRTRGKGLRSPGQSSENFRPPGEILTWP